MSVQLTVNTLQEKFGEKILEVSQEYDFTSITINKSALIEVVTFLYHEKDFAYQFLTTACGIHYPDSAKEFCMMYQLHSLTLNLRIRIKTFTTKDDLEFHSLTSIFAGANWMEREAFDFFGIKFKGHSNLKRILNVEDMDYHPLRKEYPLEDLTRTDKDDTMFGRDAKFYDRKSLLNQ